MDYQDAIYRKAEAMVRPILESNAKRFARQLDMTYAESLQEARYGLVLALREYDYNASKGGIFNFVKVAVRRHFLKAWAVHRTQARRPHVQVTAEDGKRVSLPVPFVTDSVQGRDVFRSTGAGASDFMDSFESALSAPDSMLIEIDENTTTSAFQAALENALSERDRQVLLCKHDPPRGLRMLMLDDLTDEPTIPLIGRYLGLSKNEVDWALRRIREAALSLMGRDFSDLTDLSIVRAYVERRP
jgi:RNA polymerase sigma factor (sigma-70 family)